MTTEHAGPPETPTVADPGQSKSSAGKWSLDQEAFDKLLACFSSDRDEAGRQYELMNRKLLRYFEGRGIDAPEDKADETLDRVARRVKEGLQADSITSYVYGVARHVSMEWYKERNRLPKSIDNVPNLQEKVMPDNEPDLRTVCFDRCLEALPVNNKDLIMEYYQEERRAKIELRQQLADRLSIPLNALRIRAHRIRLGLEECIKKCFSQTG